MRTNEFKLRQKEMGNPIPQYMRKEVKRLMAQGANKKALTKIFGCSYKHLQECKLCGG